MATNARCGDGAVKEQSVLCVVEVCMLYIIHIVNTKESLGNAHKGNEEGIETFHCEKSVKHRRQGCRK